MTEGKASTSTRRSAWGRYLLLFFVAAWMFVLGVLVGRGTAPVHFDTGALQQELAALRDAMVKKERETLEKTVRGESQPQKVPLGFYEALREDGPDSADPILPAQPATGRTADADAATSAGKPPHKSRVAVMAKRGSVHAEPAPPPAATAKAAPASAPTAAAETGGLTIQVAALRDGAAAERIVANLKRDGYPAYLLRKVTAGQGLWFKVRIGHYRDRDHAAADMARLVRAQEHPILVEN